MTDTRDGQVDTIRYSRGRIEKFLEDLPGWAHTYNEKLKIKSVEVETRVNYLTYLNVFFRFAKDYGLSDDILSYNKEQLDKLINIISVEVKAKIYRNLVLILKRFYMMMNRKELAIQIVVPKEGLRDKIKYYW